MTAGLALAGGASVQYIHSVDLKAAAAASARPVEDVSGRGYMSVSLGFPLSPCRDAQHSRAEYPLSLKLPVCTRSFRSARPTFRGAVPRRSP